MSRRHRYDPRREQRGDYRRGRRARYGDGYPYPSSGYYRERLTVGRVVGATLRGYSRWVTKSPDTRGLATGLAALYPAGQIAYALHPDPLLIGALSGPLALAAWVGTYKAHHSRTYSATVAATAAAGPAWLAFAAHFGAFNLPTLISYTSASALAWSAYTWSDVLRRRRAKHAEQAAWEALAAAAGLENSRLISAKETRLGMCYRVDVRSTGKRASQLAGKGLAEDFAAVLGLSKQRVQVSEDDRHAGVIEVNIQSSDPWQGHVDHPALAGQPGKSGQSIMDGPLIIGTDPDDGHDLDINVYDSAGGHHTFIVAPTGSGKTTLYSNLIEQASDRIDLLVMGVDLAKGTLGAIWGKVLDAAAGIDEYDRALMILTWADQIIKERSRKSGGRNHTPTPEAPIILLLLDELDTLTGYNSPIAHKAKPLLENIYRRGRSAGVVLATASQRGVVQYTGTKDPHANADNKIVLRMNRSSEMNNVIPEWEIDGMPNMASYARGVRGVALVVDSENTWRAGRVRDLSDLDAVEQLAHTRGAPTATLEPDIAATLPGYTDRHHIPVGAPARPTTSLWDVNPSDPDAVDRLARDLVNEVEAHMNNMPHPPEHPTDLGTLIAAKNAFEHAEDNDPDFNRAIPVPAHIAQPILILLDERGQEGASPADLVKATGKGESTVRRWLAIMRDQGLIVSLGSTRAARYFLPEHTPDDYEA